jgi:16S rRNA (guanine966-N2)-methyltransferase
MRIVSGFLKGKRMDFLKSITTRPLRDFVKESIFNVIQHSNLIDISLDGANVLDLYSGVGSFGIECISRGARKTAFVESDSKALEILKRNIKNLKIQKKTRVFETKIISFINHSNKKDKYEIIFFDPPFSENLFIEDLKKIKKASICQKKHLIVVHREDNSKEDLNNIINIILTKKYGRSKIIFGNLA